jgi:hypothetical protein
VQVSICVVNVINLANWLFGICRSELVGVLNEVFYIDDAFKLKIYVRNR